MNDNYRDCPKCRKKSHIRAGDTCPHCKSEIKTEVVITPPELQSDQKTLGPARRQPPWLIISAIFLVMLVLWWNVNQVNRQAAAEQAAIEKAATEQARQVEHNRRDLERKAEAERREAAITPQERRKKELQRQFSLWNGQHNEVTNQIKKRMNDPKSYEHVETKYIDNTDHIMVITSFRGKNAFGGVVINRAIAKVDNNGVVLEIEIGR